MPRRRDKRSDTENSDDYEEQMLADRVMHFGTVQINRMLAPDQVEGDDASKYSILAWSNTLNAQRLLPWVERKELFQRALRYLPYSYKIWHMYLREFMEYCSTRLIISKEYKLLNETFERALQKLPKMPRIWLLYCQTLNKQNLISKTRSVYNWAFRNLPLTQHQKIWDKFTKWAMRLDNSSTALSVMPRYLKLNPDFKQQFADYLYQKQLYNECVKIFQQILDDEGYSSKAKMTKEDFHLRMVDIITQHPDKCDIDGQKVIRDAIKKYENSRGSLWVKLSDYFTKKGEFDKSRDCLEQALDTIDNVKDFGLIFSAYCKFEEEMITALADEENRRQANVVKQDFVDEEIESRLAKLEQLVRRRPYLLHKINLRKNSNNVKQWISLARLYANENRMDECLQNLQQAINKIDPKQASEGKLSDVVIQIAKIYQDQRDIQKVNQVMYKGTMISYRTVDDYYNVWTRWAEIMLEERYYDDALKIIKHVLYRKRTHAETEDQQRQRNFQELLRSHTGIWQFYIDLELSFGNFESLKSAYERCKDHKCLTPAMLLNFTNFLWENAYFQESFRIFQYAVANFSWPSLFDIWLAYIHKFIKRYGSDGIGVQRTRSMFERVLKQVPKNKCKIFYFLYAEFEEEFGLYSHAIEIYDRMINNVLEEERYEAFNIYIAKVSKLLGITKTRAIFEAALQKLNEKEIIEMGRKFASIETKMGEIERARAIFVYISQFTDPKDDRKKLWEEWQSFEIEYGDRQTYKQFLRIKRSIEAKYLMLPPDLEKIEEQVRRGLAQQQQN